MSRPLKTDTYEPAPVLWLPLRPPRFRPGRSWSQGPQYRCLAPYDLRTDVFLTTTLGFYVATLETTVERVGESKRRTAS